MSILVIVPTRGRPQRFAEFVDAWTSTRALAQTTLLALLDDDDPTIGEYPDGCWYKVGPRDGFMPRLNAEAIKHVDSFDIIGSLGDDHLCRTRSWDSMIQGAVYSMGLSGVVYPDDGFQHWACATAPFITTDIVKALGWYAPPQLRHFWVDDFWLELGQAVGALRYLGDVLIEHMHPAADKAEHDATYHDNSAHVEDDRCGWAEYMLTSFAGDIERVRRALATS